MELSAVGLELIGWKVANHRPLEKLTISLDSEDWLRVYGSRKEEVNSSGLDFLWNSGGS
jgi:hypothetical protein